MADIPYHDDVENHDSAKSEDDSMSSFDDSHPDKFTAAIVAHTGISSRFINPKYWSRHRQRQVSIWTGLALLFVFTVVWMFGYSPQRRKLHQITHRLPRKAVVAASWTKQRGAGLWMEEIPLDWEIYRYEIDNPDAKYSVPLNYGREPMVYLTYIIDNYNDLPDYIVFMHGHNWSYHQPEPFIWKLQSLNLAALDEEGYISLRCIHQPTCNVTHPKLDYTAAFSRLDKAGRMLPAFWHWANMGQAFPEKIAWMSGAQFAVSKAAVLARSHAWWKRYREPLLTREQMMNFDWGPGYYWGLIHERLWHIAFGKPAIHCPSQEYCTKVLWSNGVLCDRYPVPPLIGGPIPLEEITKGTNCFKNDNGTEDYEIRTWSLCNITEFAEKPDAPCPWGDRWAQP